MSAHSAMSEPPPTHQPCTCAMTGLGLLQMLMKSGTGARNGLVVPIMSLPGSQRPSVSSSPRYSPPSREKSNPAQNARPAPRKMMTRTSGSRLAAATACAISCVMAV